MKDKMIQKGKQVTFRIPQEDFDKVMKVVGPYGSFAPFMRALIREKLEKLEKKSNAA